MSEGSIVISLIILYRKGPSSVVAFDNYMDPTS